MGPGEFTPGSHGSQALPPNDDDKGLGWGAFILAFKEGQCVARQMSRET